jgi:hypothetical protein
VFLDELSPFLRELVGHPIAFLGGFASGLLHLNLSEDPVRSWLDQQTGTTPVPPASNSNQNGKSSGPQSISID